MGGGVLFAALLLAPALAPPAAAQQTAQPADPEAVQAVPQQPPAPAPNGLLETIGRWFGDGAAGFRSHLQGAQESFNELNQRATATTKGIGDSAAEMSRNAVGAGVAAADVTRDAIGTVAKLPLSRVVVGRERCPQAANGAPDCQAAAEALCRKKGFSKGNSADFTSAEQCSPRALLSGQPTETECVTVTFISRAVCQ